MREKIKHSLASPVFAGDEEKSRLAYLLNIITISSFLAAFCYGLVAPPERAVNAGLAMGVTVIAWVAMKNRYIRTASIILVTGLFIVVAITATAAGGVDASEYGAFIVPILFSGLLLGWRVTVIVTTASIVFGAGLFQADMLALLPRPSTYSLWAIWIINSLYFILACVFLSLALQLVNEALGNFRHELEERKQAEDALLQFRKLMDETNDAFFMIDPVTSHYIGFNRTAYIQLGYSSQELSRLGVIHVAGHITSMDIWHERVKLIQETNGLIFESSYRRKDGTIFPVEVSARMLDYGKEPVMVAVVRDITERKQVETALRESEERFRRVFQSSPVAICITTLEEGRLLDANDAYWEITGYDRTNSLGRNAEELHMWDVPAERVKFTQDLLHKRSLYYPDDYFHHTGGARKPVISFYELIRIGNEDCILAMFYDMSVQKQLERDREKLIDELEVKNAESETLRESLASMAGTLEFSEIMEHVLDQIARVVPYDSASIWQIEDQMQKFIAGRNVPPAIKGNEIAFPMDKENSAYPIFIGEVPYILSLDVQAELMDFQSEPHIYVQTWLAIPLKTRGQIIGLIALDGKDKNQFNEHHAELAVTFANQVAIALENSRLFSDVQSQLIEGKRLRDEYQTLFDGTPVGIYRSSVDGKMIQANLALTRFNGYDSKIEFLASVTDISTEWYVNPDRRLAFQDEMEKNGLVANFESEVYRHKTRERVWVTENAHVVRDSNGRILYYEGTVEDITPRKQAEINLRQRESILEVVADAANLFLKSSDWRLEIDGVLEKLGKTINATHAYLFENHTSADGMPVASMRFEWTASGYLSDLENPLYVNTPLRADDLETWYINMVKGLPYIGDKKHLDTPDMDYIFDRGMKALLDVPIYVDEKWWGTIGFDDMENSREWSNSEVDALLVAGNILGAAIQRQKADAALQDELTNRKQLNAELAAKNAELERFTYTVSHDLKSPLFTIRGFLGYLEQDALSGDQEKIRRDSQRIVDATDKMQQLLNDLLELSRIGRLMNEPEKIRFEELTSEALEIVYGQISQRGVQMRVHENLPNVYGDRRRLIEVIQNLVDNAIKFMGEQPEPKIEIGQQGEENTMPIFFIRDNGIGISQEHFDRVFGLFNKLDPRSDGTGIGLALVKRIIEFHGGRVWVESEAGKGSTFYFTLTRANNT